MKTVLVATQSKAKHDAVAAAFLAFTGEEVKVVGVKAGSDVREQPFGHDETLRGCQNRLEKAMELAEADGTACEFAVSIESGIVPVEASCFGDQPRFYDIGWVAVRDVEAGKTAFVPSAGVLFPDEAVEVARKNHFDTTAGEAMLAQGTIRNNKDPHMDLTGGAAGRSALLSQAVQIALGQVCPRCIAPAKLEAFLSR